MTSSQHAQNPAQGWVKRRCLLCWHMAGKQHTARSVARYTFSLLALLSMKPLY
jgi:hypothetical protein